MSKFLAGVLVAGIVAAGAGAIIAASIAGARRAIRPRSKRRTRVISCDDRSITLERTAATEAPGLYRLYFGQGDAESLLVGAIKAVARDSVIREFHPSAVRPAPGSLALWSGRTIDRPEDVDPAVRDVTFPTDAASQSAWQFDGSDAKIWAIHIHGIHSSRRAILLGVPSTLSCGLTTFVISYRSDADDSSTAPVAFGQQEWPDLDSAIAFALANGAEKVVLVGFSMGGSMALYASTRGRFTDRIAAIILVAPALNWHAALTAGVQRAGLPASFSRLVTLALCAPGFSRLAGLRSPLRRADLIPPAPKNVPVLVIHSEGDQETPIAASRRFVADLPQATLIETTAVPHAMEPNADIDQYNGLIKRFLAQQGLAT